MPNEAFAREKIGNLLRDVGWKLTDGVSVRFEETLGNGLRADYVLCDRRGRSLAVIEAKKAGTTLTGVEVQAEKYAAGIPDHLSPPVEPLPFLYQSTGVETFFTNRLDPEPRSRRVFQFHHYRR